MSGLAWFVLAGGALVVGDALLRIARVAQMPGRDRWVLPVMALLTAGQVAIWGWLFWVVR